MKIKKSSKKEKFVYEVNNASPNFKWHTNKVNLKCFNVSEPKHVYSAGKTKTKNRAFYLLVLSFLSMLFFYFLKIFIPITATLILSTISFIIFCLTLVYYLLSLQFTLVKITLNIN